MVKQKIILIVEDDRRLSNDYKTLCKEAIDQLNDKDGLAINSTIMQAYSYKEARDVITNTSLQIEFASIDLALTKNEHNMSGIKPQPGGMRVLRDLNELDNPPASVVLTGEGRLDYARRALQNYGVLSFFQKDLLDISEYISAIKSAMWYQYLCQITDTLSKNVSPTSLEIAEDALKKAQVLAQKAGQENWSILADQKTKIKLAHSKLIHGYTDLPLGDLTEHELRKRVVGHKDIVVVRVRINNLRNFLRQYSSQEEAVFTYLRDLIKKTKDFCTSNFFVGHLGTYDSDFVDLVIVLNKDNESALNCIKGILNEFNETAINFFPFEKIEQGIPEHERINLEAKNLWVDAEPVYDLHELLDKLRAI